MTQLPVEKNRQTEITVILSVKFWCVYEVLYLRTEMYMYIVVFVYENMFVF
jgi:hypothetical protein